MNNWTWLGVYAALLVEAFLVAMAFVPLSIRLARRLGWVSQPSRADRHLHTDSMPIMGGVAIVAAFLVVIAANLAAAHLLHGWLADRVPSVGAYVANIPSAFKQLGAVLAGGLVMHAMGLVDDRRPLPPALKLLIMVLAALLLVWAGVSIRGFLPWPWLGAVLTVGWVVLLTNSFNFLDNMDGLCAGVAAIVVLAFGAVSFLAGEWFMAAIYSVLGGVLLGFLWHNFSPARLFMGDGGALFVGYMIGALSVLATYYERGVQTQLPVVTPLVVLGVPIFDTVSVMWIRWREGRPLMQGDRSHFNHRLVDLGMSPRRAVTFIYVITAVVALGALPLRWVPVPGALAILAQTALVFWIIHRIERTARRREQG